MLRDGYTPLFDVDNKVEKINWYEDGKVVKLEAAEAEKRISVSRKIPEFHFTHVPIIKNGIGYQLGQRSQFETDIKASIALHEKMAIGFVSDEVGLGVWATKKINKGDIIIYSGQVVDSVDDVAQHGGELYQTSMGFKTSLITFSSYYSNIASFLNFAPNNADTALPVQLPEFLAANFEMIHKDSYVIFKALCDIKPNTPLVVDYGPMYQKLFTEISGRELLFFSPTGAVLDEEQCKPIRAYVISASEQKVKDEHADMILKLQELASQSHPPAYVAFMMALFMVPMSTYDFFSPDFKQWIEKNINEFIAFRNFFKQPKQQLTLNNLLGSFKSLNPTLMKLHLKPNPKLLKEINVEFNGGLLNTLCVLHELDIQKIEKSVSVFKGAMASRFVRKNKSRFVCIEFFNHQQRDAAKDAIKNELSFDISVKVPTNSAANKQGYYELYLDYTKSTMEQLAKCLIKAANTFKNTREITESGSIGNFLVQRTRTSKSDKNDHKTERRVTEFGFNPGFLIKKTSSVEQNESTIADILIEDEEEISCFTCMSCNLL